jgi:predicted metal-dependent phosphoesterase TrpH
MKNADLHTHSHYSADSDVSPTLLVLNAIEVGLKYIAITDHDSVEGVQKTIFAGKRYGLEVIPGVELHSEFGEVLGYFIDPIHKGLIDLCRSNRESASERVLKTITMLNEDGYWIVPEELKQKYDTDILQRAMLAQELIEEGYVETFQEAFDKYLGSGNKYHLEAKFPPTKKVIETIKASGGVAVFAHPYFEDYEAEFEHIEEFIEAGLVGFECPEIPLEYAPEQYVPVVKRMKELAEQYNLILTSGSDYHGSVHPYCVLGERTCDESVVKQLKARLQVQLP